MATMQKMCDPETKPEEMEEIEKEKTASQKCLDQEMVSPINFMTNNLIGTFFDPA